MPGELAHPEINKWVSGSQPAHVTDFALRSRDGLPLLVGASGYRVNGYLLEFSNIDAAYTAVRRYVSPKHYLWLDDGLQVNVAGGTMIESRDVV